MKFNVYNPEFQSAKYVAEKLRGAGFVSYFAGGCVRDLLLGREPHDFDIATDAKPEQVEALFEKTVAIGKAFGIILVIHNENQIEVASFRKDGLYIDGRRPEGISFSTPSEDAQRRDFTMNGLFYDLASEEIIDFVNGKQAIESKLIAAIGDAEKRFQEDQLRLLRAVRFQAQLNFEIEVGTLGAIQKNAGLVNSVSGERIYVELEKLITGVYYERALQTSVQTGLLQKLLGNEEIIWRSAHPYFRILSASAESRWVSFFVWLSETLKNGASLEFFERLCMNWKFSKELKKKTLKAMQWVFEKEVFSHHSLGELIDKCFDVENQNGLMFYATFFIDANEREKYLKLEKALEVFKGGRPQALVVAEDLAGIYSGAELGAQLKQAYWMQLENVNYSKRDILKKIMGGAK